ncbi:hypothetical protein JXA12_04305 [Candidatus Woesearchaeota archaeon]|nr:hypothetical protein [Candidatus Woesearchaeota archaeon]
MGTGKKGEHVRNTKAQSSVEYLGTYAWAFLGLIVTIGALNYFGILDPSSYTPERCDSGSQISCADTYIGVDRDAGEATLLLMLTNNYPRDIVIEKVTLKRFVGGEAAMQPLDLIVNPGRSFTAKHTFPGLEMTRSQKEPFTFVVTYHRHNGGISHNITGSGTSLVQDITPVAKSNYCGDGIINATIGEECDPPTHVEGESPDWVSGCSGSTYCRSDCTCANG